MLFCPLFLQVTKCVVAKAKHGFLIGLCQTLRPVKYMLEHVFNMLTKKLRSCADEKWGGVPNLPNLIAHM